MTLKDIKALEDDVLTAEQIAGPLKADPQVLRIAAREHPDWLKFPAIQKTETEVVFPRLAFIKIMEEGYTWPPTPSS